MHFPAEVFASGNNMSHFVLTSNPFVANIHNRGENLDRPAHQLNQIFGAGKCDIVTPHEVKQTE